MSENLCSSARSVEWASVPPLATRDVATRTAYSRSIFQPPRRISNALVPSENPVDLSHIHVRDRPAQRTEILRHLIRSMESDQGGRHDWIAQGPAQRELRQGLVVFRGEALQLVDRGKIARELRGSEQRAEQVPSRCRSRLRLGRARHYAVSPDGPPLSCGRSHGEPDP